MYGIASSIYVSLNFDNPELHKVMPWKSKRIPPSCSMK
jgi:hypothetical protein